MRLSTTPSIFMFIVKRKSDGLYWQNKYTDTKTGRLKPACRGSHPDDLWTDNPLTCMPIVSKAGAKHSLHAPTPKWERPPRPEFLRSDPESWKKRAAHWEECQRLRNQAWDEQYEIVPWEDIVRLFVK